MSSGAPNDRTPQAEDAARARRADELRRRIEALETSDEAAFGRFTRLDWWLCVALGVVIPGLCVWWFAG